MKFDVTGIGSPLIDLLVSVDDETIENLELKKGGMFLFTDKELNKILEIMTKEIKKISPGDSTANTIVGISNLGGKTSYIGKVGKDEHGQVFVDSLTSENVFPKTKECDVFTGKVIALITPDSERTMIVHLGASKELSDSDISEEEILDSKILHLTGYQLEEPSLKRASLRALDIAKKNGTKVSIDLADFNLVKRNLEFLKEIVTKYADIVFANEDEALAFTDKDPREALDEIAEMCEIAIVKIGSEGSMIKSNGEVHNIRSFKTEAVDTTGAGDMYAAGVLYGITNELSLQDAGTIGAYAASKVVAQVGARLPEKVDITEIDNY